MSSNIEAESYEKDVPAGVYVNTLEQESTDLGPVPTRSSTFKSKMTSTFKSLGSKDAWLGDYVGL